LEVDPQCVGAQHHDCSPAQEKQTRNLSFYLQGLGIHLTSPKAKLAWFTVTTVGLSANVPIWASFVLYAMLGLAVNIAAGSFKKYL
tara:strand:+ start:2117 stop:2374 length:258 start_codon:yes stop_codon:yes gene_type:complete